MAPASFAMALVSYSSESSDAEDVSESNRKRKRQLSPASTSVKTSLPPPLPSSFLDLYSTPVRTSTADDPYLHGGRQRVTPHVVGQWPTHVYTEWYPSQTEKTTLEQLIRRFSPLRTSDTTSKETSKVHSLLQSSLDAPLPLHVSLSRSLSLDTSQRDSFPDSLRAAIENSGVKPFLIAPSSLRWVPNYPRTRWFLVIQLERPKRDELNQLLRICNGVASSFDLPGLYIKGVEKTSSDRSAPPAPGEDADEALDIGESNKTEDAGSTVAEAEVADPFHISIGWTLWEPSTSTSVTDDGKDSKDALEEMHKLRVPVTAVKAKVGNMTIHIPLEKDLRQYGEDKGRKRWLGQ